MWLPFLRLVTLCVVAMANTTDSDPSTTTITAKEAVINTTRQFTSDISTKNSRTLLPHIGPNSYPYVVSIGEMVNGSYKHLCVGVIISNENVLSTAHCVKPVKPVHKGKLYVIGGSDWINGKAVFQFDVARIEAHPRFEILKGYDIAVLKVSPTFPLLDARFKTLFIKEKPPPKSFEGTMIGWGRVKVGEVKMLQQKRFRVIGNKACMKKHKFIYLRNTDFCAVHLSKLQGACDGDSGAPFMDVEKEKLYGLLSYGRKACQPLKPYAFTHVGMFSDWIVETMNHM